MTFSEPLVLSPDTLITAVRDLPPAVREEIGDGGDYALTQARARAPSSLVDAAVAELLGEFRSESTIVEAVIRYSRRFDLDPEETLTGAYPALRRCLTQGYLVPAGSAQATGQEVRFAVGARVAGGAVVRCLHVLSDTELYQLARDDGGLAALKVLRPAGAGGAGAGEDVLRREVEVLEHLDGHLAPRLLDTGRSGDSPWLVLEWCEGVLVGTAAAGLRRTAGAGAELLRLCQRVAQAYAELHERGVVHGDVHPGNVLVSPAGAVRLVDFGLARLLAGHRSSTEPPRGGVPAYADPGYASAVRSRRPPPAASLLSEQYSVAALLYELLAGAPYLDFALDGDQLLHQIIEDDPLPFTRRGRPPWPEVEHVLGTALAKQPGRRLASTATLAAALDEVHAGTPAAAAPARHPAGAPTAAEAVLRSVLANAGPGGAWSTGGIPAAPYCSIVYGAAGLAVALYRIAAVRADPELVALADEWAVRAAREAARPDAFTSHELAVTEQVTGRVTPFHRLSGVHAGQALISHALGDPLACQQALDGFVAESRLPCDNLDLTLGRSGTLLGAAILRETMGDPPVVDLGPLTSLGNSTLAGIWSELDRMPPVAEAAALTSLGVAHGWAGPLLATLRWCRAAGTPHPPALVERLDQLAGLAQPAGLGVRWSWHSPAAGSQTGGGSSMPGWCNGSAGYVHLWTTAHAVLRDDRWAGLAERAGWDTYTAPSGIAQLCCGLAGQAYALLDLYRHSGNRRWLTAATELATRAGATIGTVGGHTMIPGSLHKGDVGVAVLAADLADPEAAAMPFFGAIG